MAESEEELKNLMMKVKEKSEKSGLKQHSKNKDHGVWSHHLMANRWGNNGNSDSVYFFGLKISADDDCSHEIKRCFLLGRKMMTNLHIEKQIYYLADKGLSNQSYGFSSNRVWM